VNKKLQQAMREEQPLQMVGTINAYSALLAKNAGFKAIYLSGAGVANHSLGLPDLAMTTLNDVCEDIRRISYSCDLPLIADADTGWGNAFMVARTVKEMRKAGASGCHIEDQVASKRCGHRPGKEIVSVNEMNDRIKAAVDARDDDFTIIARTDALAVEGLEKSIDRARTYIDSGADIIFAEALTDLDQYKTFTDSINAPVLANLTEFGMTPLYTVEEMRDAGVKIILYPLSAARSMANAAMKTYEAIKQDGTQKNQIENMQTRIDLYKTLNYEAYEAKVDKVLGKNKKQRDK
jgi:methylisocitrate lyase|tara:strand:- start:2223 stop:3101 length:879 start_codon:yes stop_codon:yes gene_type:complete